MQATQRNLALDFGFGAILGASIVIGLGMLALQHRLDPTFIIYFSLVPFFLFAIGLSGIILHYFDTHFKLDSLTYPLFIGGLFVILLLLHVFFVLPVVCPGFPV